MNTIGGRFATHAHGSFSVEEIQGDAFESQQFVVFLIVNTDHHQSNLQRGRTACKQTPRAFGDVNAMVARRVVAARSQIVIATARRRRIAMTKAAINSPMTED